MKTYIVPLGRLSEVKHDAPERTAMKVGAGMFPDCIFGVFPNRAAMARCIRMQQKREHMRGDWQAVIPLSDGEGY